MNVVIVDDAPLNLALMEKLIGRIAGCRAVPFSDAAAGLQWCLAHEPDLIIVDYRMPQMNGLDFIGGVRAHHGHDDVPILMVTADHERQTRYAALDRGANDFLNKPIDAYEFGPRVRNMLKLREAHLHMRERADTLAVAVRKATAEIHARERETITRLARAAEFRDPETGAHIQRMSHYSAMTATRMGLSETFADELLQAAPMHDVGKLGIPDRILLKPDRLTLDEMAVMRQHPAIGHDILKGSSSRVVQLGARIAYAHHERFDGTGYPQGLAGTAIPLEGRIVAVADVFDALTTARPYKPAWPLVEARAFLLEGRGRHFDPDCVDAFLAGWEEALDIRAHFGES